MDEIELEKGNGDQIDLRLDKEVQIDWDLIRRKAQRPSIYRGVVMALPIVLIMFILLIGFGLGSAAVCNKMDGFLDQGFNCHLNYTAPINSPMPPELIGLNYSNWEVN